MSGPLKMSELKSHLQCPVCTRIPRTGPIYQCDSGHILCKDCRLTLSVCPSCNVNLSDTRNLVAEKMLDSLPKTCKFAGNGCPLEFEQEHLEKHESSCNFRLISCVLLTCRDKVPLSRLLVHIQKSHSESVELSNQSSKSFIIRLGQNQFQASTASSPTHLKFRGYNFFLEICRNNDKGLWYFWIYLIGSRTQATSFFYKIQLSMPLVKESVGYEGGVVSIDVEKQEVKKSGIAFELSDAAIVRLISDGNILCRVLILDYPDQKPADSCFYHLLHFFKK